MGTKRELRRHAEELLVASRVALRYFFAQTSCELEEDEAERQRVMQLLRKAIEAADPPEFNEVDVTVRLVMTHLSWKALRKVLESAGRNEDDQRTLDAVLEGQRETRQRVYVTLPIDQVVLRRLKYHLDHRAPTAQTIAFKRLSEQIEKDGLHMNPMEVIARMAL